MPTTHLATGDPERAECAHKHHGRTAKREQVTCSYCLHLTQHGANQPMTGIARALYEMGNERR